MPSITDDSPAQTPPPGNPRFAATSGLRGLIALGVLTCHATAAQWAGPWWGSFAYSLGLGIYVFFALSGFLLYRPFLAARAAGKPPPRLRDYLRRRAVRILPAYWIALTLLAVWPGVPGVFSGDWWVYYGFLQIYSDSWLQGGLPQVWSLCVDVSFYLALPLWAWGLARARLRPGWLAIEGAAVLGLIVLAFAWRGLGSAGWLEGRLMLTLPGFLSYFALGMGLAVLSVALTSGALQGRGADRLRRWVPWALPASLGFYVLAALAFGVPADVQHWFLPLIGRTASPLGDVGLELAHHATLFALTACLVAPMVIGDGLRAVDRALSARWLVGLGTISYGVYLWHVPVLEQWVRYAGANRIDFFGYPTLGQILAALCISGPLAYLSYRYAELPFLRLKEPRARRLAAPPAVGARVA